MDDTIALLVELHHSEARPHAADTHMLANWGLAHILISVSDYWLMLSMPKVKIKPGA